MAEPQHPPQDAEAGLRSALQDVVAVVKKLAPHCKSVDDLIGMCNLALDNDGQLSLLMDQLSPVQFRGKK